MFYTAKVNKNWDLVRKMSGKGQYILSLVTCASPGHDFEVDKDKWNNLAMQYFFVWDLRFNYSKYNNFTFRNVQQFPAYIF